MLDGGKTPLKVVHTKPAVRLLATKMAALQLSLRAAWGRVRTTGYSFWACDFVSIFSLFWKL